MHTRMCTRMHWEKVGKVEKSRKSWEKSGKSWEKLRKVGKVEKSDKSWEKLIKVEKSWVKS